MKTRRGGLKKRGLNAQHAVYHSTQYNSTIVNGQQVATEKTVDIRNGKGAMTVKKMADGRVLVSTTKRISPANIRKIRNNIRVPKLFSECIKCNTRKMEKLTAKKN